MRSAAIAQIKNDATVRDETAEAHRTLAAPRRHRGGAHLRVRLAPSRRRTGGAGGSGTSASSDDAPLKLHRCVIERDYGNARLDIDLRLRNDTAETLVLQPPKARLLAAKGREIPAFFLPFEKLPEVPPKTTQDVQLRYWLEAADLQGALKLEVEGGTIDVKSAKAFDLEHAEECGEENLRSGDSQSMAARYSEIRAIRGQLTP